MKKLKQRVLSAALTLAMVVSSPIAMVKAAAEDTGKYVSEVFIAYGKTEDDARKWLTSHGWEPVGKDLNAGKLSYWDSSVGHHDEVAAVMGIHRTNDPDDAITDMAVMNMNGGYSFKDYDLLVKEKQTEINEFLSTFVPVLEEYRVNYNGHGSAAGKARADLAHDLLNRFYDGEIDGEYAMNDTGKPLGDLLLHETRFEFGENNYAAITRNKQLEYGDLQQIILESSGPAVLAMEQALAMATDTSDDTWLERLSDISGVNLVNVVKDYVPGASKQNLSASAAKTLLQSEFGDAAVQLAAGYDTVQQDLIWYEAYLNNNDLWQNDDESNEDYTGRVKAHFKELEEKDKDYYEATLKQFYSTMTMYYLLESVEYEGDWGETLLEFFYPEDGTDYGADSANFLPFAAVLSDGQRAGLGFLSLYSLLRVGAGTERAAKDALPDVQEIFGEADSISIYSGINRTIFRGGVALTSQARMLENMGRSDWFDEALDWNGIGNIAIYASTVVGILLIVTGLYIPPSMPEIVKKIDLIAPLETSDILLDDEAIVQTEVEKAVNNSGLEKVASGNSITMSRTGIALMALGGAILIAAAGFEAYQMYNFYQRDFTEIPMMIVDEADIVTYMTDENGNPILDEKGSQKKDINFDQYAYYEVVKCNRQEVGEIGDWQDGVSDYKKWGCGDAADLNCDCGKQWLAMYTIKSPAKGNPILAESLTYQTGSDAMPANCTRGLHFFTYEYAMNIADEAYCYNNDKGGIYLFWKDDPKAYNTASTFTTGQLALAGIGGLVVGILGATAVLMMTKKKKETPDAPAAA